jgi:hypothetical protein
MLIPPVAFDEDGIELVREHFLGGLDEWDFEGFDLFRFDGDSLGGDGGLAGAGNDDLRSIDPLLLGNASVIQPSGKLEGVRGIEVNHSDANGHGKFPKMVEGQSVLLSRSNMSAFWDFGWRLEDRLPVIR